ncbi:hypothetical protein [uncultured Thiohalocapsa sp.]|uniref:hypothetical protein n=1 Tax=uncultured Thiohalocapsa sp. TaxID=768990 RepID=UPI0025F05EA5|nr:hypothetical protein [uncultured Thiohalocapsa sp.]
MNLVGTGLATVAAHWLDMRDPGTRLCCVAMLLGRLQSFTILVLLTPALRRR